MSQFIIYLIVFFALLFILNLCIYFIKIYFHSKLILNRIHSQKRLPNFSIDELIYFVTFPTNLSYLQDIQYHQIKLSYEVESMFTLVPKGVNILLKINKDNVFPLAYLHIDRILVAEYMFLHYEKKITTKELLILQQKLFYSKKMRTYIKSEVYKKLCYSSHEKKRN